MWDGGTYIEAPVPALWCKEQDDTTWAFELLLTDTHEGDWVSRRDARITLPLSAIGALSPTGIPYLVPEIVLAYKAKDRGFEKDQEDFFRVLPHLTVTQRAWLAHTLRITNPDHPWLNALKLQ